MKVLTTLNGAEETIEIAPERIYAMEPALGGFPDMRRYVLINEEDSPVEWLQSLDDASVVFALIEPFLFMPDYSFELSEADMDGLGVESPDDVLVRCLVTLREDPSGITANLLAPLIFSRRTHLARQIILQDSEMPIRFPLFEAIELAATA
ncbi:MAG: flagellar assembly protein FliW [Dehalococcoidia bacterium]